MVIDVRVTHTQTLGTRARGCFDYNHANFPAYPPLPLHQPTFPAAVVDKKLQIDMASRMLLAPSLAAGLLSLAGASHVGVSKQQSPVHTWGPEHGGRNLQLDSTCEEDDALDPVSEVSVTVYIPQHRHKLSRPQKRRKRILLLGHAACNVWAIFVQEEGQERRRVLSPIQSCSRSFRA